MLPIFQGGRRQITYSYKNKESALPDFEKPGISKQTDP